LDIFLLKLIIPVNLVALSSLIFVTFPLVIGLSHFVASGLGVVEVYKFVFCLHLMRGCSVSVRDDNNLLINPTFALI
jgi:hypothetical protein